MTTTKITFKIREDLLRAFNSKLDQCFLKRDAFLNHIISSEVSNLRADMKGLKLSKDAKRYISHQMMSMDTKVINVVVDKETAKSLKSVIEDGNMVRDAFINRLLLFLLSPDNLLDFLELAKSINHTSVRNLESMPTSPLKAIGDAQADPFYYLRHQFDGLEESLYTVPLPEPLQGFSCFLPDSKVPGTAAYQMKLAEQEKIDTLLKEFDL